MMSSKSLIINVHNQEIHAQTWGSPDKTLILALHGWLDNSNSFSWLAEYLAVDYYVVALDLPGHGHSTHIPPGNHYHFTDGIFIMKAVIEQFERSDIYLLGHSMGACLASLVASMMPRQIQKLLLIEGLGPLTTPEDDAFNQIKTYLHKHDIVQQKQPRIYQNLDAAAQARSRKGRVSFDIAKELCVRGIKQVDGQIHWRHDPRLLISSPLQMTENQVLACMREIQMPTLLIWGSEGYKFNEQALMVRVNSVKDIKETHLSGGHHLHMEQPAQVAKVLIDFIND